MKKRVLSLMLALVMALCLCMGVFILPVTAADSDFTIKNNGTLTKYNGPGGVVTIPDEVNYIGNSSFASCDTVTSVIAPKGVAHIGEWAFAWCDNLTNVIIGDGTTYIEEFAFYGCKNMYNIVIPDSVTSVGYEAFGACKNLTNVYYAGTKERWDSLFASSITGDHVTVHVNSVGMELNDLPVPSVNAVMIAYLSSSIAIGESITLTAEVSPAGAPNKKVTWSSEDTDVAVVDQNGVVTGIATGFTTIKVTTDEGGYSDSKTIFVRSGDEGDSHLILSKNAVNIKEGASAFITALVSWSWQEGTPEVEGLGNVYALSADTKIATVAVKPSAATASLLSSSSGTRPGDKGKDGITTSSGGSHRPGGGGRPGVVAASYKKEFTITGTAPGKTNVYIIASDVAPKTWEEAAGAENVQVVSVTVTATSPASVSATLTGDTEGELTVEYTRQDGQLALAQGAIPPGHRVVAALYNAEGHFVGTKVLTAGQSSAQLSGAYTSIRLFWLDGSLKPMSAPAEMSL